MAYIKAKRFLIAGLAAALVPLGSSGATAAGETSTVTSLNATNGNGTVQVSGAAAFIRDEVVVGTSPAGTSELPPAAPGIGMDLSQARIRQISHSTLEFNVDIRDMAAVGDGYGVKEVAHYDWDFNVVKNGKLSAGFTLQTIASSQLNNAGSLDAVHRLLTCVPDEQTAQTTCTTVGEVDGQMHAKGITYKVPVATLSAAGAVLEQNYDGVASSYGASGAQWYIGGDRMAMDSYTVHAPTVQVGVAPAGTPDAEVALTNTAPVGKTGSFTTAVPTPATAGEYKVVAKACLGDSCGLTSTPLLVP